MSDEGPPERRTTVSDEAILAVFRAAETPVLTTAEVADELPIGHRATLKRLKRLGEAGELRSKQVGPRGQVWWIATAAGDRDGGSREDPFVAAPTYESGERHVSTAVDRELAAAIADETDE